MSVRRGELNRRLSLLQKQTTRDVYGAEIADWSVVATVWAKVTPVFARERNGAPQTMPVEQATVLINWRTDITAAWRIRYRDKDWQVTGIAPVGRDEALQLTMQIVEAG